MFKTLHADRSDVVLSILAAAIMIGPTGCKRTEEPTKPQPQKGTTAMAMTLRSAAFDHGKPIPAKYSGDGADASPPLAWSDVPDGTREFALIVDDPDAPTKEPWVHWVVYKIPADARSLAEGIPAVATVTQPAGTVQGLNTWPKTGYGGPAPPRGHGVHHYHFKLYALDTVLDVEPGLDKTKLLAAMKGHILAQAELIGTYQR